MEVRKATRNDVPQLAKLFYEFYWKFNMNTILSGINKKLLEVDDAVAFSEDSIKEYFTDNDIVFVCEENNELVGYISGSIKKHKHYQNPLEAHIYDWFVTEKQRGKGTGLKLYNAFLEYVKDKGCNHLTLEAFSSNTDTIKTYERMGFTKEEVVMKKMI